MHFHNVVMKHFSEPKHFRSLLIPICFSAYKLLFTQNTQHVVGKIDSYSNLPFVQWRTQKVFGGGGSKFCHNRVASQINFMGSVILGWPGGMPRRILQNYTKKTHFRAFWSQVLVLCFYETY